MCIFVLCYQLSMDTDIVYMRRCLQLARLGMEHVAPNPMVGAVVVHEGRIIGEGYHRRFGGLHAEPNAIASVVDKSLLPYSTLYVNLEPCSHYGKTPPCAELIARMRIPRVVVGTLDPNPRVAGRGVEMLRQAGVEVLTGVLAEECRELNKRFLCYQEKRRPYIVLKWAQTRDGFIDRLRTTRDEPVAVISNVLTKQRVHQIRTENMAILVGTRTALLDNPGLRVTRWTGRNPLRVVIDRQLGLDLSYKLLDDSAPTLVFSERDAYPFETSAEIVRINFSENIWPQILHVLYERQIHSVLVEGGAQVLDSLLDQGLWDELQVEVSPECLGNGVKAPPIPAFPDNGEWIDGHCLCQFRNPEGFV